MIVYTRYTRVGDDQPKDILLNFAHTHIWLVKQASIPLNSRKLQAKLNQVEQELQL